MPKSKPKRGKVVAPVMEVQLEVVIPTESKRYALVKWVSLDKNYSIITLGDDREVADYLYERIDTYKCKLIKLEPDHMTTYTVVVGSRFDKCGCPGYKTTQTCKHVSAIKSLQDSKRI